MMPLRKAYCENTDGRVEFESESPNGHLKSKMSIDGHPMVIGSKTNAGLPSCKGKNNTGTRLLPNRVINCTRE
jgi:hypothetical protein